MDPAYPVWDPSRSINNINVILATCGSLLVVDEERFTVHFIHSSVTQFLLGHFGDNEGFDFNLRTAEAEMAQTVVTYLSYNVFDTQLSTKVAPSFPADQTTQAVISSIIPSSSRSRSIALHVLRSRKAPNFDLGKALATFSPRFKQQSYETFRFYQYAKANWLAHTKCLTTGAERLLPMLRKLIQKGLGPMTETEEPLRGLPVHFANIQLPFFRAPTLDPLAFWAVKNSHHGIFRSQIRDAKYGIQKICQIATFLKRSLGYGDLDLPAGSCLLLLGIAAEFKQYDTCNYLLNKCASKFRWRDVLDIVIKRGVSQITIAIILVQAQIRDGACSPTLWEWGDEATLSAFEGVIVRNASIPLGPNLVIGDKVMMSEPNHSHDDIRHWTVSRNGDFRQFTIPRDLVAWTSVRYLSCCEYHFGISVG